jgi:hypothetical protein
MDMKSFGNWITAQQLMERWNVAPRAIYDTVRDGLEVYQEGHNGLEKVDPEKFCRHYDDMPRDFPKVWFPILFIKMEDILDREAENEISIDEPLSGRERTRLGQLEAQVKRTNEMLEALSYAIEFCHERGGIVRRSEIASVLLKKFEIKGTTETFRKIWSHIPKKYKKPGAPLKNDT